MPSTSRHDSHGSSPLNRASGCHRGTLNNGTELPTAIFDGKRPQDTCVTCINDYFLFAYTT